MRYGPASICNVWNFKLIVIGNGSVRSMLLLIAIPGLNKLYFSPPNSSSILHAVVCCRYDFRYSSMCALCSVYNRADYSIRWILLAGLVILDPTSNIGHVVSRSTISNFLNISIDCIVHGYASSCVYTSAASLPALTHYIRPQERQRPWMLFTFSSTQYVTCVSMSVYKWQCIR